MAKIVSGRDSAPSGLEQFAFTYDLFSKHRRDREQKEQQGLENQIQFQKLMNAMQSERLKSQQLLNQQAQMGDVHATQQLALQAKLDPAQVDADALMKMGEGITDPKARAPFEKAVAGILEETGKFNRFKAADEMLQHASESPGLFQPEQIQEWSSRLQAKRGTNESPDDVMSEIMGVRQKAGEKLTNSKENEEALTQAQQVVESLPRGSFERRQADIALNAALSDEGGLARQGFGAKVLKAVQGAALGPREGFDERQQVQADARPMPGLSGMNSGEMKSELEKEPTLGFGGPKIPEYTGGTRATSKGLAAGTIKPGLSKKKPNAKGVAAEVFQKGIGPKETLQLFRSRGFDVNDPAVLEEIKMALQEARGAAGGK